VTRENGPDGCPSMGSAESGFSLVELMISTVVMLGVAGYIFSAMADMHKASVYQGEVQSVVSNARRAAETLERLVTQAGHNPLEIAMDGVVITDATQVRLRADLTGSSGTDPNRGDPDGDTNDLDEDITVRYSANDQQIQLILADGTVRPLASGITAFSMQYLDRSGATTNVGSQVSYIRFNLSAATRTVDPQTHLRYAFTETFAVRLQSR